MSLGAGAYKVGGARKCFSIGWQFPIITLKNTVDCCFYLLIIIYIVITLLP